jgi:[ribosomal protein S18]-alanine N-acetyltransferase
MTILIRPFREGDGAAISAWRYPPPYDVYNDDRAVVDDPALASSSGDHYAMIETDELAGFCSFGVDGRAPGFVYTDGPLDVGIGLRPDLTGRGNGVRFLTAALAFATRELGATEFRATVAAFNERALRACERVGFRKLMRFDGPERAFWVLGTRTLDAVSEPT